MTRGRPCTAVEHRSGKREASCRLAGCQLSQRSLKTRRRFRSFADIQLPTNAKALFHISVQTTIGDGMTTHFWTDRWLHGKSFSDLAPELMKYVRRRGWKQLTVRDALEEDGFSPSPGPISTRILGICAALGGGATTSNTQDIHIWITLSDACCATRNRRAYPTSWLPVPSAETFGTPASRSSGCRRSPQRLMIIIFKSGGVERIDGRIEMCVKASTLSSCWCTGSYGSTPTIASSKETAQTCNG